MFVFVGPKKCWFVRKKRMMLVQKHHRSKKRAPFEVPRSDPNVRQKELVSWGCALGGEVEMTLAPKPSENGRCSGQIFIFVL